MVEGKGKAKEGVAAQRCRAGGRQICRLSYLRCGLEKPQLSEMPSLSFRYISTKERRSWRFESVRVCVCVELEEVVAILCVEGRHHSSKIV